MKLKALCTVKTNLRKADVYIVSAGNIIEVGKPVFEFAPFHIGVKINVVHLLDPDYLYYMLRGVHSSGIYQELATGTAKSAFINSEIIKNIEIENQ